MRRFYRKLWRLSLAATLSGVIFLAPVANAESVHTVSSGESLWSIAQKHHIDVETLAKINGIKNTQVITVGTKLKLSSVKVTPRTYTVRSGESLWTIARKFNMDVKDLARINGISNTEMIKVGMKLKLDSVSQKYKVKSGESLWSISQKFGVKYTELIQYNNLRNPDQIRVGSEIMIPPVKVGSAQIRSKVSSANRPVVQKRRFVWPVRGRISSPFGPRWGKMHQGIDIAIPVGKNIVAAASGKVVYGGWISGYGWTVIIEHNGGYRTLYAHNSKLTVKGGDWVKQGQLIAKSGNSGRSTGPHLHFEVQKNTRAIDPMVYLR